jgi:hypothetical protein
LYPCYKRRRYGHGKKFGKEAKKFIKQLLNKKPVFFGFIVILAVIAVSANNLLTEALSGSVKSLFACLRFHLNPLI